MNLRGRMQSATEGAKPVAAESALQRTRDDAPDRIVLAYE
jgi:hypothetical protein